MAKLNPPATIKVGPHDYRVLRKTAAQMGKANGSCEFDSLEIWLRKRLRASKLREILLHEVLHACTHPLLNGNKKFSDEDWVSDLSVRMLGVLRDNQELTEFLTAKEV